jgi:hypothetical protein
MLRHQLAAVRPYLRSVAGRARRGRRTSSVCFDCCAITEQHSLICLLFSLTLSLSSFNVFTVFNVFSLRRLTPLSRRPTTKLCFSDPKTHSTTLVQVSNHFRFVCTISVLPVRTAINQRHFEFTDAYVRRVRGQQPLLRGSRSNKRPSIRHDLDRSFSGSPFVF